MPGIVKKITDEGSSVPFIARAWLQVFEIRDQVFRSEQDHRAFDGAYMPILENLAECREARKAIWELCATYEEEVRSGGVVRNDGETLHVDTSIDSELNSLVKEFFVKGHIALEALKSLNYLLGFSLSALMGSDENFKREKTKLLETSGGDESVGRIIAFVEEARKQWLGEFKDIRRHIEHHGWSLPPVDYIPLGDGKFAPVFPPLADKRLSEALIIFWNRLFDFCEQIVVAALGRQLKPPRYIVEIPQEKRDPDRPTRFKVWADFN